jgi:radical SAM superfamily enzyme YgiQ (UPF0313 family)
MESNIQNILLIAPKTQKAILYDSGFRTPPLGICYLASSLREYGYNVQIVDEFCEKIPKLDNFDLVGCFSITATTNRAYKILDEAKNLGKLTAIGGPHVSALPEEAERHADFVIIGEGEKIFPKVLKMNKRGVHKAELIKDLDNLPFPALDLYRKNKYLASYGILTSRGCPYNCTFCAVHNVHGRSYRTRSVDKIIEELKYAEEMLGEIKILGFLDDNLTLNKTRIKKLFSKMIEEGITPKSASQVSCDMAEDPELLKLATDVGFCGALVGFESISDEVLKKDYNKKHNVRKIRNAIKAFHDYGIFVYGMFVFGADHEDKKTFRRTLDFANEMDIDFVQASILTPLPGTQLFEKFYSERRIINFNWDYYDCAHCVFKPKNMTKEELETGTLDFWQDFYGWRKSIPKLFKFVLTGNFPIAYVYWNLKRKIDKLNYSFFD